MELWTPGGRVIAAHICTLASIHNTITLTGDSVHRAIATHIRTLANTLTLTGDSVHRSIAAIAAHIRTHTQPHTAITFQHSDYAKSIIGLLMVLHEKQRAKPYNLIHNKVA